MAYAIIGDIHGQADKLEALLRTLGYRAPRYMRGHSQAGCGTRSKRCS